MAQILYGKPVREEIKERLISKIKEMEIKPSLLIIQVGDREDSNIYIKNKINFGNEIGASVLLKKFGEKISEEDLEREILKLVNSDDYRGVIVQLPLPKHLDTEKILKLIPKNKDADGLSMADSRDYTNVITPATARAVMSLLHFYNFEVKDKNVTIIGKSKLAGQAIADFLEKKGSKINIFDKTSEVGEIKDISKKSEILISATGNPKLITEEYVNTNQVVIDVGINRLNGKTVGDVHFETVSKIAKAITPVPGGIGPLTVACLFENLLEL